VITEKVGPTWGFFYRENVIVASIPSNLPPRGVWFRFSSRARFYDKPGWPVFRRYFPSDKRIMDTLCLLRKYGATICFYQLHHAPPESPKWIHSPALIIVEAVDPSYKGKRFIPSWFESRYDPTMKNASIIYVHAPFGRES